MKGTERRQEILRLLSKKESPLSGTWLAEHFSVSRQVIVQDMALIRAEGQDILSTNRGYLLHTPLRVSRVVKVFHSDEEIADELFTIVDMGGTAEDVSVNHRVYGRLHAPLGIASRRDVQNFLEKLKSGKSTPLKDVTSGFHYHTISADSEETLDLIERELEQKGYLCPKSAD
ncbi:MAG: transcription repressor NadR [Clostridiales bacterium]|nr:transcription repressor NadR [Clostridiales bacterium]